jgi:hypothetical protein
MAAKVDSSLIQDGYQIYQHNFLFTKSGSWTVVQQGMNINNQTARRYHWLSSGMKDFLEEPHSGIISGKKVKPLNLIAKASRNNKEISVGLIKEEPKKILKEIRLISEKSIPRRTSSGSESDALIKRKRLGNFSEMELNNIEFHWHKVLEEKFDLKRLTKTVFSAHSQKPENFEELLSLKGVGPKTIRALSLVAEMIYGARPSFEDPARYSFAHGGKDGTPYFVERDIYDKTLEIMENGIKKSKITNKEKVEAQKRLNNFF